MDGGMDLGAPDAECDKRTLRGAGAPEDATQTSLRRNLSAPALEGEYKGNENIIMTVRRYSISSNVRAVGRRSNHAEAKGHGPAQWDRVQEEVTGNSPTVLVSKRSLQDYMHKNRTKVKTVTFLLPVEDIYTNRPVLTNHMPDRTTYNMDVTVEKDF
ncbi:hypothetical protein GN956_G8058 [Arapaima gigas]